MLIKPKSSYFLNQLIKDNKIKQKDRYNQTYLFISYQHIYKPISSMAHIISEQNPPLLKPSLHQSLSE